MGTGLVVRNKGNVFPPVGDGKLHFGPGVPDIDKRRQLFNNLPLGRNVVVQNTHERDAPLVQSRFLSDKVPVLTQERTVGKAVCNHLGLEHIPIEEAQETDFAIFLIIAPKRLIVDKEILAAGAILNGDADTPVVYGLHLSCTVDDGISAVLFGTTAAMAFGAVNVNSLSGRKDLRKVGFAVPEFHNLAPFRDSLSRPLSAHDIAVERSTEAGSGSLGLIQRHRSQSRIRDGVRVFRPDFGERIWLGVDFDNGICWRVFRLWQLNGRSCAHPAVLLLQEEVPIIGKAHFHLGFRHHVPEGIWRFIWDEPDGWFAGFGFFGWNIFQLHDLANATLLFQLGAGGTGVFGGGDEEGVGAEVMSLKRPADSVCASEEALAVLCLRIERSETQEIQIIPRTEDVYENLRRDSGFVGVVLVFPAHTGSAPLMKSGLWLSPV